MQYAKELLLGRWNSGKSRAEHVSGRFIEPTGFDWSHDPLSTNSSSFPDPNPPIHKSVGPGRQDALRSSSNDCPPACLGMARPEFSRRLKIGSPSYWPSSP